MAASALAVVVQSGFAADDIDLPRPASLIDGLTIQGGVGLTTHSNGALQDENRQSDLERIVHADIGYQHADDGRFLADLDYSAERRDFLHDAQTDQTAVNGRALLVGHLLPNRLDLILENQLSEALTDTRLADVTGNQERRSVTTAGLDGYAHLSDVDALVLSPRYTDVRLQSSTGSNSQRSSVSGTWQHRTSPVTQTQVSVSYGDVRFDESSNNYTTTGVQVGFKTSLSRLSYQLAVGFDRFDRDQGKNVDGYMLQAGIDYQGDGYTWGGSAVHQLTDTSIGLSQNEFVLTNFQAQDSNFDEQDILKSTQLELYAGRRIMGGQLDARIGYHKYDYDTLPRDEQGYYGQIGYQYPLNIYWSLGADVRYEKTRFLDDPKTEYNEVTPEVYALYRWSERLTARLGFARRDRHSNDIMNRFTDNQAMLDINYRFY